MNRVRSILFAVIVVISSSTLALGGEIQFPGRTDPPPPPPAASTESINDAVTAPTQAGEIQIMLQGLATAVLNQILLTIY
jgi:hypothetical protein